MPEPEGRIVNGYIVVGRRGERYVAYRSLHETHGFIGRVASTTSLARLRQLLWTLPANDTATEGSE